MVYEKCSHPTLEFAETSANDNDLIEYYPAIYGLKAYCVVCGKSYFEDEYEQWKNR
jgi:hypothetical protein